MTELVERARKSHYVVHIINPKSDEELSRIRKRVTWLVLKLSRNSEWSLC